MTLEYTISAPPSAGVWPDGSAPKRYLLPALLLLLLMASQAQADPVLVAARQISFRPAIHAWAKVESVAPLELHMPIAAQVARINVVQGQAVVAGTTLVTLSGPRLDEQLAAARARVTASRKELNAAQETADSVKRSYPALTDRRALASAQSALAAAQVKLDEAEAEVQALHAQTTLRSPLPAVVDTVHAAPGTFLPAGAPLLTLFPKGRLWLKAEVFDESVPQPAKGRFIPGDGTTADVHLVSELPARSANGARVLNFAPVDAVPDWQAGETGDLVISGPEQTAVAVPAEALVLDAGQWYVLAESAGKLTPLHVTPGPTRDGEVVILRGLKAGTAVVARQAYLLYHRDFATRYTPPD
jgi:multidrug efflux pump subunit AcrA (membrane-fusion protein)